MHDRVDSSFQWLITGPGSTWLYEGHAGTQQSEEEDKVRPSKL